MRRDFDGRRFTGATVDLLDLLSQPLVRGEYAIELLLLPIHNVAQLLRRALEVRDLELDRIDPLSALFGRALYTDRHFEGARMAEALSARLDIGLRRLRPESAGHLIDFVGHVQVSQDVGVVPGHSAGAYQTAQTSDRIQAQSCRALSAAVYRPHMIAGLRIAIAYLLVTAVGTLLYWLDFFVSGRVQVRADPVYLAFERAFPLADAWMAACALIGAIGLVRRRPWGLLFGLLAASAQVFLALMDVMFNLNEGNYSIGSGAMAFEVLINAVLLAGAPWLIVWLWRNRAALLGPRSRPGA